MAKNEFFVQFIFCFLYDFTSRSFLPQKIKKTAAIFLSKNYHSWVFLWWITICLHKKHALIPKISTNKNATPMQMSICEITPKQVLWLASYEPKFAFLYPAFAVSHWLSFDNGYKNIRCTHRQNYAGDSHPIPFSQTMPWQKILCTIARTLCEGI